MLSGGNQNTGRWVDLLSALRRVPPSYRDAITAEMLELSEYPAVILRCTGAIVYANKAALGLSSSGEFSARMRAEVVRIADELLNAGERYAQMSMSNRCVQLVKLRHTPGVWSGTPAIVVVAYPVGEIIHNRAQICDSEP